MRRLLTIFIVFLFHLTAFAQDNGGNAERPSQVGAFLGRVLPNGITREDNIFAMWGARFSTPAGKSGNGYYDMGLEATSSGGVKWNSLFTGISMHIPVETLIGHAGVGLDFIRYSADGSGTKTVLGGHFIGGVFSRIGGNVLARFDMKLTSKPGTSLFFGIGLVIELDKSSGGAGGN